MRISEKERIKHKQKLRKIERKNEKIKMKQELKFERNKYKKKTETSKILAITLMSLMLIILMMIMGMSFYVIINWRDVDTLHYLINGIGLSIIGEVAAFAIYSCKSFMSKREEEKIKFEREKYNLDLDNSFDVIVDEDNNYINYNNNCSPIPIERSKEERDRLEKISVG